MSFLQVYGIVLAVTLLLMTLLWLLSLPVKKPAPSSPGFRASDRPAPF